MAKFLELFNSLDPDPYVRGKQFEHVCKWYLKNDPIYADLFDEVWLWSEWPKRWKEVEAGIDLVARHKDGTLWAIQSKAYAETTPVTMHDISQFLSESGRPQFSYRLLITTTEMPLINHAGDVVDDSEKPVGVLYRSELKAAKVTWPASIANLAAPQPPKLTALPHQVDAINAIVNGFDGADRGQLISACGTGKTLSAMFVHEKMDARRTLVLVPNLLLLQQTLHEWTANATEKFAWQAVCSDMGITDSDPYAAILRPQMHVSELGFPVTTDPEEIAAFLRKKTIPRVIFSTYHSSPQIAEAFKLGKVPAFDLVIADEAHRVAGPMSSAFATILFADKIKAKRRLFMTATPRNFSAYILQKSRELGFEHASMNEEAKFGPVFHKFGFAEAIECKRLTPFKVAVIDVTNEEYREWADAGQWLTIDGVKITDARTVAGQLGMAKAMRDFDLHRVLTFHNLVKDAKAFAASLPEVIDWMPAAERPTGALWSKYADGTMSVKKRSQLLDQLRELPEDQRGMLSSARCLAEGIDVPTLDGIAFIDPRRSEVDIAQAVGRAIRLAEGKEYGYIVIPVFIDPEVDPEVALNDSSFETVWRVVRVMATLDEELAEFLSNMRRMKGHRPKNKKQSEELPTPVPLPDTVDPAFARAFALRLVEMTTAPWEQWFGMLEQFAADNKHARVPCDHVADGYRLGQWVVQQRHFHGQEILDPAREQRLQDLPGWSWDLHTDQWEEGFALLEQYIADNGDACVPQAYKVGDFRLGQWIGVQRIRHTNEILEADREARLLGLKGWAWDGKAAQWEKGFNRLLKYVEKTGTALVQASEVIDGYKIGAWVNSQRARYNGKGMPIEQQQRLLELPGWTWDILDAAWEKGFSELLKYVELNKHAQIPVDYKTAEGYRLGGWARKQRSYNTEGKLDSVRFDRLSGVDGWSWNNPTLDAWEEGFSHLLQYVKDTGNACPPQSQKTAGGYRLGQWVSVQRQRYAGSGTRAPLTADQIKRLKKLKGWSWGGPKSDEWNKAWEKGFNHLLEHIKDTGNAYVPRSCETADGYNLGGWAQEQRALYNNGSLKPDRKARLQKLVAKGWLWKMPKGPRPLV